MYFLNKLKKRRLAFLFLKILFLSNLCILHPMKGEGSHKVTPYLYEKKTNINYQTSWKVIDQKVLAGHQIYPTKRNGRYFNSPTEEIYSYSYSQIVSFLGGYFLFPTSIDLKRYFYSPSFPPQRSEELLIHWLGHSTLLIQVSGMNLLVDPVFDSFHPLMGGRLHYFKRHIPPGIALKQLPPIDMILISHCDYDHMEEKALLYFKEQQPLILIPEGLKKWFLHRDFSSDRIHEFTWWQERTLGDNQNHRVKITSVPALHGSYQRDELKHNESLWSGYMIQVHDKTLYFAGDTGFDRKFFKEIHKDFPVIDLAFLPIAPDQDEKNHMNIRDTLYTLDILEAKKMIPIHWGAYRTGNEKVEEPYYRLLDIMKKNPKLQEIILPLRVGGKFKFPSGQ